MVHPLVSWSEKGLGQGLNQDFVPFIDLAEFFGSESFVLLENTVKIGYIVESGVVADFRNGFSGRTTVRDSR